MKQIFNKLPLKRTVQLSILGWCYLPLCAIIDTNYLNVNKFISPLIFGLDLWKQHLPALGKRTSLDIAHNSAWKPMESHSSFNKNDLNMCSENKKNPDSDESYLEDIGFSDWSDSDSDGSTTNHNLEELMGLSEVKEELSSDSGTDSTGNSDDDVILDQESDSGYDRKS